MRSYNDAFKILAAVSDHPKKTPPVIFFLLSIHSSICHYDIQLSKAILAASIAFLIVIENLHVLIFLLHEAISYQLRLGLYFDTGYSI